MRTIIRRLAVCLALLLVAAPSQAQPWAANADRKDVDRVRRKVENLRVWQLTEDLRLDEATASRLFPVIREADEERLRVETNNRSLVREMAQELRQDPVDEGKVARILDRLVENRREQNQAEERHIRKVRGILSAEDTARYVLFTIRFQREIRERIEAFAREKGAGDGLGREFDGDRGVGAGRGR